MKFFAVFLIFVLCFLGSTVGLQCYQCKDKSPHTKCEEYVAETCEFPAYCGILSFVDESGDNVVRKGCTFKPGENCKINEAVEVDAPSGEKGSLYCCEGNLCNKSNKLTYKTALFYSILFSCIFSLFNFMKN